MIQAASIALGLSYFLVVWLKTNAFVEYMHLFRMTRFFHVKDYLKIQADGYGGSYTEFLAEYYYESFFVRLIICPVCLSFWLAVLTSFFVGVSTAICIAPLVLFFYLLFNKLL